MDFSSSGTWSAKRVFKLDLAELAIKRSIDVHCIAL